MRWPSDLEQSRPALAGDEQASARGVPGDAVEHAGGGAIRQGCAQPGGIEHTQDFAALRVDAQNIVGVPDVGPDLAVDVFELVESVDRDTVVVYPQAPNDGEIVGVEQAQGRAAVAHDQMRAVPGQPPALAGVVQPRHLFERIAVIDECDAGFPGQLVEAVIGERQAFAEVTVVETHAALDASGGQVHAAQRRAAVESGAFEQQAVVDQQALGERARIVRVSIDKTDRDAVRCAGAESRRDQQEGCRER